MTTFDHTPGMPSRSARDAAHHALQLVAAAGVTLLEPDPLHHHSSTTYDPAGGDLVGAVLPSGSRASLNLETLRLSVGTSSLDLGGRSTAEAVHWLADQLGVPVRFPDWEMPSVVSTFEVDGRELSALGGWFAAAHSALSSFRPAVGEASEIRVWPHHFDLAMLVTLKAAADPENMRSVGLGMTPGDGGISTPYLYVTPWPYPQTWAEPALPAGRWNVEGWYGAVLEGPEIRSVAQVGAFLDAAFGLLAAP